MTDNGNAPIEGERLTLELLDQLTCRELELPTQTKRAKRPITVMIGMLSPADYFALLPAPIPESDRWTEQERPAKVQAYLEGLGPEAREAWQKAWSEVAYKICAAGCLDPALTSQTARRLGRDAEWLSQQIILFSGLVEEPESAQA